MLDTAAEAVIPFSVSESAARRITALVAQEGDPGAMFRVSVSGGGCSGFQYAFSFDSIRNDDDRVFDHGAARVVIDEVSLELLSGSQLDFVEDLAGSHFAIRNPNATSSCGCGNSFAL